MTWRRLGVLIDHLPPESATKTALREAMTDEDWANLPEPVGHGPWSHSEHLLAAVVDALNLLAYQQSAIHSKNPPGSPPEPLRRPGQRARVAALSPRAREYLEARRRAHTRED